MTRTKKLINNPDAVVDEMIDGILGAYPDILERVGETGRAVVAKDGPRQGKVGLVVGGGSGHEPAFVGYVGRGLADAAAMGNVFASPSPEPILEATRAVDGGAGVVYLYGNYAGDVMNFDMAAEDAGRDGIEVRSVVVNDDVASAPAERAAERRGVAGDFFVFRVAGAAADRMMDLDAVEAVAQKANRSTLTMGVALGACSLPQTLKPNFELGEDDMEIGMGVHGEPGISRGPVEPADAVVDALLDRILGEMQPERGTEVALLVNSLGATSLMELYILHRRALQRLDEAGIRVHRSYVGEYVSSLEMAGASLSVLRLDDELKDLLEHPCQGAMYRVGAAPAPATGGRPATRDGTRQGTSTPAEAVDTAPHSAAAADDVGELTSAVLIAMFRRVAADIEREKDWLSELDGIIGDGDHGVTMGIGWSAVSRVLATADPGDSVDGLCHQVAKAFLDAVGASSGPLYATAFRRAGEACAGRHRLDAAALVAFLAAARDGLRERGGAAAGDKTMMDAWIPAVERAADALAASGSVQDCLDAAATGAEAGMKATADMKASKGRSSKLGERSLGHMDPGAASTFVTLRAMARAYRGDSG